MRRLAEALRPQAVVFLVSAADGGGCEMFRLCSCLACMRMAASMAQCFENALAVVHCVYYNRCYLLVSNILFLVTEVVSVRERWKCACYWCTLPARASVA